MGAQPDSFASGQIPGDMDVESLFRTLTHLEGHMRVTGQAEARFAGQRDPNLDAVDDPEVRRAYRQEIEEQYGAQDDNLHPAEDAPLPDVEPPTGSGASEPQDLVDIFDNPDFERIPPPLHAEGLPDMEPGRVTPIPIDPDERIDISDSFFTRYMLADQGDTMIAQTAGELGVPGQARPQRDQSAQATLSHHFGDDAGHRLGNQFGAPGTLDNLALQNRVMNREGGTWYELESEWREKLMGQGIRVFAVVEDYTPRGSFRPDRRIAKWIEVAPDGTITMHQQVFMNPHSADTRVFQFAP